MEQYGRGSSVRRIATSIMTAAPLSPAECFGLSRLEGYMNLSGLAVKLKKEKA